MKLHSSAFDSNPPPAPAEHPLPPSVVSYVAGVVLLSCVLGAWSLIRAPIPDGGMVLLWTVAFLVGEAMSFRTPTGRGNVSMAATIHLAAIPVAGIPVLLPAAWVARLVSNLMFQRQPWYKAMFNAAQVSLAVLLASQAYRFLGGAPGDAIGPQVLFRFLPGMAVASIGYYVVNTGLVSGVLALVAQTGVWQAWRENFGYRVELVNSVALFLLAPVATITYQDFGAAGLTVFFLPMLFIRDACDRYIVLERTQRALIGSERLAAKGEMAASVGHELNNYLSVLNGNLQLLQLVTDDRSPRDQERLEKIFDQIRQMTRLSRGLMDFSRTESRVLPTDIGGLVLETVEFLRPQNRLDGVEVSVECDARTGVVLVDPAQMQQVLMNLINNAADAMTERGAGRKRLAVWVRWISRDKEIELGVSDSGPGIPPELRRRVFEPSFTTRPAGHGYGLPTVYRIVHNHGGSIAVEAGPEGGALFRIRIPRRTGAGALRAA